jgi:hypothetical protein
MQVGIYKQFVMGMIVLNYLYYNTCHHIPENQNLNTLLRISNLTEVRVSVQFVFDCLVMCHTL